MRRHGQNHRACQASHRAAIIVISASSCRSSFATSVDAGRQTRAVCYDSAQKHAAGGTNAMAAKTKIESRRPGSFGQGAGCQHKLFHDQLLARAPQEDLAGYKPADLDQRGGDRPRDGRRATCRGPASSTSAPSRASRAMGRPVSVITVVNDNMPFLFDSVLGEITESAGEPTLVIHPVVPVRHGKSGVCRDPRRGEQEHDAAVRPRQRHPGACRPGCRRTGRKG